MRHVVYTSFAGAAADATFTLGRDHFDTEQAIREAGLTHTFLRDNFYLDVLPWFADEEGVIRGPAGEGRVAAVARADVADVAAAVLRDPAAHADAAYQPHRPRGAHDGRGGRPGRRRRRAATCASRTRPSRRPTPPAAPPTPTPPSSSSTRG